MLGVEHLVGHALACKTCIPWKAVRPRACSASMFLPFCLLESEGRLNCFVTISSALNVFAALNQGLGIPSRKQSSAPLGLVLSILLDSFWIFPAIEDLQSITSPPDCQPPTASVARPLPTVVQQGRCIIGNTKVCCRSPPVCASEST